MKRIAFLAARWCVAWPAQLGRHDYDGAGGERRQCGGRAVWRVRCGGIQLSDCNDGSDRRRSMLSFSMASIRRGPIRWRFTTVR